MDWTWSGSPAAAGRRRTWSGSGRRRATLVVADESSTTAARCAAPRRRATSTPPPPHASRQPPTRQSSVLAREPETQHAGSTMRLARSSSSSSEPAAKAIAPSPFPAKCCKRRPNLCLVSSARCNTVYTSRAYATMSVSVCMSVTEVHWRIITNLGFKFRSKFSAHCRRGEGSSQQQHLALC